MSTTPERRIAEALLAKLGPEGAQQMIDALDVLIDVAIDQAATDWLATVDDAAADAGK